VINSTLASTRALFSGSACPAPGFLEQPAPSNAKLAPTTPANCHTLALDPIMEAQPFSLEDAVPPKPQILSW
jgi:hypothetical protein